VIEHDGEVLCAALHGLKVKTARADERAALRLAAGDLLEDTLSSRCEPHDHDRLVRLRIDRGTCSEGTEIPSRHCRRVLEEIERLRPGEWPGRQARTVRDPAADDNGVGRYRKPLAEEPDEAGLRNRRAD
jgi:hypothetical protein